MLTTSPWITLFAITKMYVTKYMPWGCATPGVFRLTVRRGSCGLEMSGKVASKRSISSRPAEITVGARSRERNGTRVVRQPYLTRVLPHRFTNMAAVRVLPSPADMFIEALKCPHSSAHTSMATSSLGLFGAWDIVDRACFSIRLSEPLVSSHPSVRGTMRNCF